jgi:hypothetical protein
MSRNLKVIVTLFAGLLLSTGTAGAQVPQYYPKPFPPRPYQVRPQFRTDCGAWITYVQPGGPADRAGLERGDIILSVNGWRVTSREHLLDALTRSRGRVELEVINCRDYSRLYVTVFPLGNNLGFQFTIRDLSPDPWDPSPRPHPWPPIPRPHPRPGPWDPAPNPNPEPGPWSPMPGIPGSSGMVSSAR